MLRIICFFEVSGEMKTGLNQRPLLKNDIMGFNFWPSVIKIRKMVIFHRGHQVSKNTL